MIDLFTLATTSLAGLALGFFFFGGLLWTVETGLSVKHTGFWFFGSWLVRMTVFIGVLYLVGAGRVERFMACTAGFLLARIIITRFFRTAVKPGGSKQETGDAPQS